MNNSYVLVRVIGKNTNLFIKRLLINKYVYKDLKQVSYNEVRFKLLYRDYLCLINKKHTYKIEVIKYYGILKYIAFLKNNISFSIIFFISLVLLFILSNTCFEISIVHNNKSLRKLVKQELDENNIKVFRVIPSFSKRKEIINEIINKNKDKIEWLEIKRTGSKLTVELTERKINPEKENLLPRHVIAKKSGIIKKIEASQGVIIKKKNEYVTKGDIIVSGNIIKDDTIKASVAAKGSVYAETWYKVNIEYPLYYKEVKYLENVKNNIIIKLFNKELALRKNYTDSYLEKKHILVYDKIFPFNVSMERQRKTKVTIEELTEKQALDKAIVKAENKLNVKLEKDEYIISKKTLNYQVNNSKIIVDVFFKVYENITDYKDITLDEIQNIKE